MRGEDELRQWLERQGFGLQGDPLETRDNQCDWIAYRRTKIEARECECNADKVLQITVKPFAISYDGHTSRSVEIDVCGEYAGDWYHLTAYAIHPDELPDKLDAIEARLVKAWNALPVYPGNPPC